MISVDLPATRRRIAKLRRYVESTLLTEGHFVCPHYDDCLNSLHSGDVFREGVMSHVGRRFDLSVEGRPLRIVVVGQESGLAKGPAANAYLRRVTMQARYQQVHDGAGLERRYYAEKGFAGRNPHMRGTTTALRLLLGAEPGTDFEGEFIRPVNGHRFHLFDGFAMVNRLLCSAGPAGGSKGRPTATMAVNCTAHFAATLEILDPTIVVLQGAKVSRWAQETLAPVRNYSEHLYESRHADHRVLVCSFSHPSAHGALRWGDRPDAPYVEGVVSPALREALRLSTAKRD